VAIIAVLPALLAHSGLGLAGRVIAGIARWVLLLIGMMLALSVLYRYAPDRDNPRWLWSSTGALVATVIWLAASAGFAIYTGNFGKYNETYGSMGAVIVLMLWLFITALSVIIGAELNAELERQTKRDTTQGPDAELGARGAEAADTVGATADEVKAGHHGRSS
jgi:membrane protein